MQRTNDTTAITPDMAQAFKFLSQLGLQEAVVYGADVDARAKETRNGRIHLDAVATLPKTSDTPVAALLHINQQLRAAIKLNARRPHDFVMPREILFYNESRFGVLIGSTHLNVVLTDKPVDAMRILAAQPAEHQVAVQGTQGSLARTETQARRTARMQMELA